jgi:arginine utilization protein RocB
LTWLTNINHPPSYFLVLGFLPLHSFSFLDVREEDEEEYLEKIQQQLAMQEEDDPEKIKEEARRRKEAIMAKYRQQQLQHQQVEYVPSGSNGGNVIC